MVRTSGTRGISNEGMPTWPRLPNPPVEPHMLAATWFSSSSRLMAADALVDAKRDAIEFIVGGTEVSRKMTRLAQPHLGDACLFGHVCSFRDARWIASDPNFRAHLPIVKLISSNRQVFVEMVSMVVDSTFPLSSTKKKTRRAISATKKAKLAEQALSAGTTLDDDRVMLDIDGAAEEAVAVIAPVAQEGDENEEEMTVDATPAFPPLPASAQTGLLKSEIRRIPMPPHRMTPLKNDWANIFTPLTEILGLQVRMNVQKRSVEVRVSTLPVIFTKYSI